MATVADIISTAASLQNDTAQDVYTNNAVLPYFNLALHMLQEEFELHDIPVTQEVSTIIPVNIGITAIGFTTTPALPVNLIEIKRLWESPRNQNNWIPMTRRDFLPHYLETDAKLNQLLIWSWTAEQIRFIGANAPNDIKLDYVKYLFTKMTIANINDLIPIINSQTYLEFKTAALCSLFIGENETRATVLENQAEGAKDRALGINVKGRQQVKSRRRPFRAAFKARSRV